MFGVIHLLTWQRIKILPVASENIAKETKCIPKYGIQGKAFGVRILPRIALISFPTYGLNERDMLVKGQFNVLEQSTFKVKIFLHCCEFSVCGLFVLKTTRRNGRQNLAGDSDREHF